MFNISIITSARWNKYKLSYLLHVNDVIIHENCIDIWLQHFQPFSYFHWNIFTKTFYETKEEYKNDASLN